MPTSIPEKPPLLNRTLRLGVTGHKDLDNYDGTRLRETVDDVLTRLARFAVAIEAPLPAVDPYDSAQETKLVVVSALAAGADCIVADAAVGQGYELWAPLPFAADVYRKTFDAGSPALADFERLLAKATAVIELYGDRKSSKDAYLEVGLTVLDHADIVIAILDDGPDSSHEHGQAGTKAIAKLALESLIPVIVIPPHGEGAVTIRMPDRQADLGLEDLDVILESIFLPTGTRPTGTTGGDAHRNDDKSYARKFLDYRAFLREKRDTAVRRWLRNVWCLGWNMLTRRPLWRKDMPISAATSHYDTHYRWASSLAGRYAERYRCSFFTNYLLGAAAVTLVLLTTVFEAQRIPLFWAELVLIVTILLLFMLGRRHRWHDRAADYRILAELLRQMRVLEAQALVVPNSRPPAHYRSKGDLASTWISGHFQAIVRSATPASRRFTESFRCDRQSEIADTLIKGQVFYHEENHGRMEFARNVCTRLGITFFLFTFVACVSHLVLHYFGDAFHCLSHHTIEVIESWLVVAAASFPAWAAALHGIESQAEFHRLADRSESMEAVLRELKTEFPTDGTALAMGDLRARTRTVSSVMVEEAIDWRVLYPHGIPTA